MFFKQSSTNKNKFELNLELNYTPQEVLQQIPFSEHTISDEHVVIPCDIFRQGLSGLEAIIKYLKEEKKLKYSEISRLLKRDHRTIWTTYNKKKIQKTKEKKDQRRTKTTKKQISFSTKIIQIRNLSVLEAVANHLKEIGLSTKEISEELGRNNKTIWTVLKRAEKKIRSEVKQ